MCVRSTLSPIGHNVGSFEEWRRRAEAPNFPGWNGYDGTVTAAGTGRRGRAKAYKPFIGGCWCEPHDAVFNNARRTRTRKRERTTARSRETGNHRTAGGRGGARLQQPINRSAVVLRSDARRIGSRAAGYGGPDPAH